MSSAYNAKYKLMHSNWYFKNGIKAVGNSNKYVKRPLAGHDTRCSMQMRFYLTPGGVKRAPNRRLENKGALAAVRVTKKRYT